MNSLIFMTHYDRQKLNEIFRIICHAQTTNTQTRYTSRLIIIVRYVYIEGREGGDRQKIRNTHQLIVILLFMIVCFI